MRHEIEVWYFSRDIVDTLHDDVSLGIKTDL